MLLEAGIFDGMHAVLMLHPGPSPYWGFIPSQAGIRICAQFSKAAGVRGIDATAALELEQALRRALVPLRRAPYFCRVAPEGQKNVGARADMFIAGTSVLDVDKAREPVRRCLQQAASAAGISVEITEYTPNAVRHNDELLAAAFRANAEELGRRRENDPRIQAELKYLRAEFLRRMRSDPRQTGVAAQDGKASSGRIVPRRAAGQGALRNRPGPGVTGAASHSPPRRYLRHCAQQHRRVHPIGRTMRPPVQCWTELSLSPRRPWTQPLTPI